MKEPVLFKNQSALILESEKLTEQFVCEAGTRSSRLTEWVMPATTPATLEQPLLAKWVLLAKEDSEVEYVFFQNLPEGARALAHLEVRAKKNAKVKLTIIQNGATHNHVELNVHLEAPGAEVEVRGVQNAIGAQKHSLTVHALHSQPHTRSDLNAWCIARDQSQIIFNGLVTIEKGAHHTEAYQKNKNLILSDKATVDSFPKLFIANDDVKCAHGSSTSTLDPNQALYLESRGISGEAAEKMLIDGFINQALNWVQDQEILNTVKKTLQLSEEVWS